MEQVLERLAAQDRMLQAILSALAPAGEPEGPGLGDLIEALADLTAAVDAQGQKIDALRSLVSGA